MSAKARFLPWVRRAGFAGNTIQVRAAGRNVNVAVSRYGPGDVVGITPGQIRRREPMAGSLGFAPNLFPYVEFTSPDFPWCVTPVNPDARSRLKPWLALIVREAARESPLAKSGKGTLPVIEVPRAELPPENELAVWAHVQIDGADPQTQAQVDNGIARLLCPRLLAPLTRYIACLVPAFEAGRLAGLGETPPDPRSPNPAWGAGPGSVVLPVYDHWFFITADSGDLETLARRLRGRDLSSTSRPLRLDVTAVAGDVDGKIAPFDGALRPLGAEARWTGSGVAKSAQQLRAWLDGTGDPGPPVIGPPLYGSIATRRMRPEPSWLAELNLDPRRRAAAGLGAQIVQQQQDELVDDAWRQAGDVERARREREGALLAEAAASRLHLRAVAPLAGPHALVAMGPALARMRGTATAGPPTAAARLASSALPPAGIGAAFRRILATKVPNASRRAGQGVRRALALRNDMVVTPGAPAPTSAALVTRQRLTVAMQRAPIGLSVTERFRLKPSETAILASVVPQLAARKPAVIEVSRPKPFAWVTPAAPSQAKLRFERRVDLGDVGRVGGLTGPLMTAPHIDRPLGAWLHPAFLLAGVDLPPDTMGLLEVNALFVEALLIGANHELARELLWRGVPLDRTITLLTRFFEARASAAPRDLTPIASWQPADALGSHLALGERGVFVMRSRLVSRLSEAVIFLARAEMSGGFRQPGATQLLPVFRGLAGVDTAYFGFEIQPEDLAGSGSDPGWYIVIQEREGAARFGFDEEAPATLTTWNDLAWPLVSVSGGHVNLGPRKPAPAQTAGLEWGRNSAHMASISLQRPIRVAIHASQLMPGKR